MILLMIVVFSDHLKAHFWNSQEPIIVYEVSWLSFDNLSLYHVPYVPCHIWRKLISKYMYYICENFKLAPKNGSVLSTWIYNSKFYFRIALKKLSKSPWLILISKHFKNEKKRSWVPVYYFATKIGDQLKW